MLVKSVAGRKMVLKKPCSEASDLGNMYVTFFGKDAVKYLGPGEGKSSKIVQIIS